MSSTTLASVAEEIREQLDAIEEQAAKERARAQQNCEYELRKAARDKEQRADAAVRGPELMAEFLELAQARRLPHNHRLTTDTYTLNNSGDRLELLTSEFFIMTWRFKYRSATWLMDDDGLEWVAERRLIGMTRGSFFGNRPGRRIERSTWRKVPLQEVSRSFWDGNAESFSSEYLSTAMAHLLQKKSAS